MSLLPQTERNIERLQKDLSKINPNFNCSKGTIKNLYFSLGKEEEIKYCVKGTFENKTYNVFVTNKRVIFIYNFLFALEQIEIPIEKITSITKVSGILNGGFIIWDGISRIQVNQVPKNDVLMFINILNEEIQNHKTISININNTREKDITDKIEKLSDLYKEGILTEYEFATKKMELLDKLKK